MIYDVERLVKRYLAELPPTCEGVGLEALDSRIRADLLVNQAVRFRTEGVLRKAGWYKHHHQLPDGVIQLQARRCYCRTDSSEICEERKRIPASSPLPEVTTDYDTNLDADFWNWVCNRRAGEDQRGEFIRDTRILLEIGKQPGALMMDTEAVQEYVKLRVRWAAEIGVHPEDCSPLAGRAKVSGTGWYLCCQECNSCECDGSGCNCGCDTCAPDC